MTNSTKTGARLGCGVPQGSILGPVLFTLYINDILSSIPNCHAHLYADDTILYSIADSADQANLQLSFNSLQTALTDLKLVLNARKTKTMLFSRATIDSQSNICILTKNGSAIERVSDYKYLGIWLDEKLSFKTHIDKLVKKLRQKIGYFYRNRSNYPMSCRRRVIEAVFMSVLDYGDLIYRQASATTLKPLDAVYHSAIRFITGDPYDTHHCTLYANVGWPSLAQRRDKHMYLFIYKALLDTLPPYICALLSQTSNSYCTRSSELLLLNIPRIRTDFGETAFSFCAPTAWNNLQRTLKLDTLVPLSHFKSLLNTYFSPVCTCFK